MDGWIMERIMMVHADGQISICSGGPGRYHFDELVGFVSATAGGQCRIHSGYYKLEQSECFDS